MILLQTRKINTKQDVLSKGIDQALNDKTLHLFGDKYFFVCRYCCWMLSTLPNLWKEFTIDFKGCPLCDNNEIDKFPII